jgi:uroporphyrin-3 C-methyltransferase
MSDPIEQPSASDKFSTEATLPASAATAAQPLGRIVRTLDADAPDVAGAGGGFRLAMAGCAFPTQPNATASGARLSEVEAANKGNQMLVAQNQELVRELGGKLSLLETKYAETQNQRAALETLYQEMSSSRDQTALAEVEQMLLIAGQQLQLSGNVKAALIAMQQAESRLQRPAFAVEKTHRSGYRQAARFAQHRRACHQPAPGRGDRRGGQLPLAQDTHIQVRNRPVAASDPADGMHGSASGSELGMETNIWCASRTPSGRKCRCCRRHRTFFLRENLKLRLLSARMALLTRDEVSFRRDLKTSQEWLKRYFDT